MPGLEPRRDLLIEHLHRLQDALGGLTRDGLAALADVALLATAWPEKTDSVTNTGRLARLGLRAGQPVRLRTRRGSVTVATRADEAVPDGAAFLPFAYAEAAANLLTIAALDPVAKIAEVKHGAVTIEPVAAAATV